MSSAARELPPLAADRLGVREARPVVGPERDALAAARYRQAERDERDVTAALDAALVRLLGVVQARLRSPRARRDTKWWAPRPGREVKAPRALDADHIVPDRLVEEIEDALRPVALRVARDAAADAAGRLGVVVPDVAGDGMFALDESLIASVVDEAIGSLTGMAQRHVVELRRAVLDADVDAETLDEVLERVATAHRRGGNWLLLAGRTLVNALANDTTYRQARALGATHVEWVATRTPAGVPDDRVRPTHVVADGQMRLVGDDFEVGGFALRFPADPQALPEAAREVHGCRCGLGLRRLDEETRRAVAELAAGSEAPGAAVVALAAAANADPAAAARGALAAPMPVVGYRALDVPLEVQPGQLVDLPAATTLSLLPLAAGLVVLVAAGTAVAVGAETITLPGAATLEVIGVAGERIITQALQ